MENNNLYPNEYVIYDIGSWFYQKLFNCNRYNFTYNKLSTHHIFLRKIEKTSTDDAIINCRIEYDNGATFYQGRMYGFKFHIGKFYYEDGEILYNKNA